MSACRARVFILLPVSVSRMHMFKEREQEKKSEQNWRERRKYGCENCSHNFFFYSALAFFSAIGK